MPENDIPKTQNIKNNPKIMKAWRFTIGRTPYIHW